MQIMSWATNLSGTNEILAHDLGGIQANLGGLMFKCSLPTGEFDATDNVRNEVGD